MAGHLRPAIAWLAMSELKLPELHESVHYEDERGRASVSYTGLLAVRVEDSGFINAGVGKPVFDTVDALFAELPDDAPRHVFMDHREVSGISLANAVASLRWFIRRHDRLTMHMLLADLNPVLRGIVWLCGPIIRWACEYHPKVESFEAALEDWSTRELGSYS